MDYAKAKLLVSAAHIIDLAGADSPTCERWLNATSMFGPVEFSIEPGNVTIALLVRVFAVPAPSVALAVSTVAGAAAAQSR